MGESADLSFAHEAKGWVPGQDEITASVIIPMRNEEKYIGKCLQSILANDFPKNRYEVLVVDGASTDNSRAIAERMAPWFGSLRVLDNPKGIVPTGMNTAIRASRGRYIIRMDAHTEYPDNYISACVKELDKGVADVVGGRLITRPGADTLVARAIALMTQHPFGVGNSAFRINSSAREVDTVPFGAFRREVFDKVGLFQESLARHQDFEMNARIRAAGGKILLNPSIQPTYYNVPTLGKFMRQAYLNGVWMGRSWTRYPVCFCWRHAAPLGFVSSLMVPLLLGLEIKRADLGAAAILIVYLLAALVSSVHIASRHGARYLLVMPLLFLSYHAVYGLSTIWGFLTFFTIPADKTASIIRARGAASENL
jgi:glycosyltransferase involved in cell wall biosynthesis